MTLKTILHVWFATILVVSSCVAAETLDDVLGVGKSDFKDSSQETKDLWEKVLTTLETNQNDASLDILKQFDGVKDVVEPYQKTFTSYAIKILSDSAKPADTAKPDAMPQLQEVAANKSKIEVLQQQIQAEENKKPAINKKIKDASTGSAIGGLLGGLAGIGGGGKVSDAGKQSAEKELGEVEKNITEYRSEITALEKQNVSLQQAALDDAAKQKSGFREKMVSFLLEQKEAKRSRPAIALATLWLNMKGTDAEITKISQAAVDMLKAEKEAIRIAKPAIQPARDLMTQGRLWEAKAEIMKAVETISTRIQNQLQLEFIKREMSQTASNIEGLIARALKQRSTFMDIAARDANEAAKKLEEFKKTFPDYPEYDQDKIKIGDLKAQQVEKRFAKNIAAIEQVIPNDPAEAKAMIKKLFSSDMDPDEISILKSKVVKLNRDILQGEADLIRKDLDEAQSFLTKFSATYAEELKTGGKPKASFMQTFTTGVENLVRARSLQAGGVKRLELLLTEEMDTVTKSKFVGLLETQKAALEQMDGTLAQNQRNKTIMIVLGSLLVLGIIGGGVFAVLKMKKTKKA